MFPNLYKHLVPAVAEIGLNLFGRYPLKHSRQNAWGCLKRHGYEQAGQKLTFLPPIYQPTEFETPPFHMGTGIVGQS
jgi:hypothetical protein